jgi:hypothetical protein
MPVLTTAEIMEFVERKLQHESLLNLAGQIRLRNLWLNAAKADSLERIAKQLEDGQLSILEGENIATNIKLIADRMHD